MGHNHPKLPNMSATGRPRLLQMRHNCLKCATIAANAPQSSQIVTKAADGSKFICFVTTLGTLARLRRTRCCTGTKISQSCPSVSLSVSLQTFPQQLGRSRWNFHTSPGVCQIQGVSVKSHCNTCNIARTVQQCDFLRCFQIDRYHIIISPRGYQKVHLSNFIVIRATLQELCNNALSYDAFSCTS